MPSNALISKVFRLSWLGSASLVLVSAQGVAAPSEWPGTLEGRMAALTEIQTLNAALLSRDSATLTLDDWCARHGLASPATVIAERVKGQDREASEEVRAALHVTATDVVRYRRVRLRCGTHILSDADNWYVPARLTPEMNAALDGSDAAFGRVVQPLHFQRHTLSARLLWSPLPDDWDQHEFLEATTTPTLEIPEHVLEHRALLTLPNGTPISEVIESYTREVLAFSPPRIPDVQRGVR